MILPDKHITFHESLLGLGSFVMENLSSPKHIEGLWEEFEKIRGEEYPSYHSFDSLILTVTMLYAISQLKLSGDVLHKETKASLTACLPELEEVKNDVEIKGIGVSDELVVAKNHKVKLENILRHIDISLQVKPDLVREKFLNFYQEMLSVFKEESLKKIEAVENFNKQLIKNRMERLNTEKIKTEETLLMVDQKIKELSGSCKESVHADFQGCDREQGTKTPDGNSYESKQIDQDEKVLNAADLMLGIIILLHGFFICVFLLLA